jgi:hypothetical protein
MTFLGPFLFQSQRTHALRHRAEHVPDQVSHQYERIFAAQLGRRRFAAAHEAGHHSGNISIILFYHFESLNDLLAGFSNHFQDRAHVHILSVPWWRGGSPAADTVQQACDFIDLSFHRTAFRDARALDLGAIFGYARHVLFDVWNISKFHIL